MAVQFKGVLSEAAPFVAYVPIDVDGKVAIVAGVPIEVYELVRLVVNLARCLYADVTGEYGITFVRKYIISVLVSDTVRLNAVYTTATTLIIFLSYSGNCETTPASSAYNML